jgi:hypothetical protein
MDLSVAVSADDDAFSQFGLDAGDAVSTSHHISEREFFCSPDVMKVEACWLRLRTKHAAARLRLDYYLSGGLSLPLLGSLHRLFVALPERSIVSISVAHVATMSVTSRLVVHRGNVHDESDDGVLATELRRAETLRSRVQILPRY